MIKTEAAREAGRLESSLVDAGMPPDFAAPALSIVSPQQTVLSTPCNIRLVSDAKEGPWIRNHQLEVAIDKPGRPGRVTSRKVPAWPWANEGKLRLEYEFSPVTPERWRQRPPQPGACLKEFISLAALPSERFPKAVVRFAQKWDTLGICRHGKPFNHPPSDSRVDQCWVAFEIVFEGRRFESRIKSDGDSVFVFSEPIEAWERYSRQLRAILCVAANLRTGKLGSVEDWQTIEQGEPPQSPSYTGQTWGLPSFANDPDSSLKDRLLIEQRTLAGNVGKWFTYGGIWYSLGWNDVESRLETHLMYNRPGNSLPGRLAVELLAVLSHAVYRCKGCGEPFGMEWEEKRRPSIKAAWCGRKGCKRIKDREASRRYYYKNQ